MKHSERALADSIHPMLFCSLNGSQILRRNRSLCCIVFVQKVLAAADNGFHVFPSGFFRAVILWERRRCGGGG
jgi:hypothetical protein